MSKPNMALDGANRPRNAVSPTFTLKPNTERRNTHEELADISSGFESEDLNHINPRRIGNIQEDPHSSVPVVHSDDHADCTFQTLSGITIGSSHDSSSSTPSQNSFCTSSSCTPHMKDRMRRKLRYFFMNPIEKWNAKGRAPWKLALQVLKIFFVTTQLLLFGSDSSRHQELQENTEITFRQLLLKDWDSLREIESYPPSTGPYAVYTKTEFYDHVNYVIRQFTGALGDAIGSYGYDTEDGSLSSMHFCKRFYKSGKIWPSNSTLDYDSTVDEKCLVIPPIYPAGDERWNSSFRIESFLVKHNFSINFDRLLRIKLKFSVNTVFLKTLSSYDSPECFKFHIHVLYDNTHHDGQVVIALKTDSEKLPCHSDVKYQDGDYIESIVRQVLNVIVIIFCCLSTILCSRSLYKGQCLRKETSVFFKKVYGHELSLQEQLEFVDFWYVMIIINDVLIVLGSALKIEIEHREVALVDSQYHIVSMLLGIGNLLVWAGVLRYLGFFDKYNLLILTLKRALPNVLRFTLCCILLYAGFCCCGWVVLGPYHIKFRRLSSTSECLFALMNGDDMFATFAITHTRSNMVWWFSRVYLYLFICLFIYVVISLFISVIMDAYETIKQYYEKGFPLSELQKFIAECNFEASSGIYRLDMDQRNPTYDFLSCFSPCCRRKGYDRI